VNGREETWRLEWRSKPAEICSPEEEEWYTCPCDGFEFGESGQLDLVRLVKGREIDRLSLSPLFTDIPGPKWDGVAALPHWPRLESDLSHPEAFSTPGFAARIRKRNPVKIMRFGDYDHDGQATEFVLQVGASACGFRRCIVVGVGRGNDGLHAFCTAEQVDEPLGLRSRGDWEIVRKAARSIALIQLSCGDHGSETEETVHISWDARGLHATVSEKRCSPLG